MTERKRIACFFSGGYTEFNAMKSFFEKINPRLEYIRLCPIASRKSNAVIRERNISSLSTETNGRTGESLINYVLSQVEKNFFQREAYDAIIIEDDKDNRFLDITTGGTGAIDLQGWEDYQKQTQEKLVAKGVDVPIFYFLAAPEVEAWFAADFDNSFGNAYQSILKEHNSFFMTNFRRYLNHEILTEVYADEIEAYSYFNGQYRKLSDELQYALKCQEFLPDAEKTFLSANIEYKKTKNGSEMLRSIQPEKVADKCRVFFRNSYYELQRL